MYGWTGEVQLEVNPLAVFAGVTRQSLTDEIATPRSGLQDRGSGRRGLGPASRPSRWVLSVEAVPIAG